MTDTAIGPQNCEFEPPMSKIRPNPPASPAVKRRTNAFGRDRKSTLQPMAMGTRPSTVVMAVSITGRNRVMPALTRASSTGIPRSRSCST